MNNFLSKISMKSMVVILFVLIIPALLLYNLETSPRPWHDDGNAMLLASTLAEDGVYAVKTSTGYQTFGAVQSVGPTVILPVALSFKVFGVGILQGRIVLAIYSFLTLLVIYKLINTIFDTPSALFGLLLLLGSASSRYLFWGRQVMGEVPALGFFLAGWYFWLLGRRNKKWAYFGLAGLLIGASMITKSSYAVIGGGVFVAVIFLDLIYYRQRNFLSLAGVAGISFIVFSLWVVFQRQYYGSETFQENLGLLNLLGKATTGFSIGSVVQQAKFLFSFENDYFYFLWGIPALVYALILCLQKNERGFLTSVLTTFTVLWLMYYFYSVPWPAYLFAPAAVASLFTGKLFIDLLLRIRTSFDTLILEIKSGVPITTGLFVALLAGSIIFVFYPFQNAVQYYVLKKDDAPRRAADFLDNVAYPGALVETWERELGVLTDLEYHYPDQSYLIMAHAAKYRNSSQEYLLGYDYFETIKPSFVVIGRFAREFQIYDVLFLEENSKLIGHIDEGLTSYEIYEINYPLAVPK